MLSISKGFEDSRDCMRLSRKDFSVVKELMDNSHTSAPLVVKNKLRSFLLISVLMWSYLFLGWLIFCSMFYNRINWIVSFLIISIGIIVLVVCCIKDIYRLIRLRKSSLISRRLNTSSVERTFPVSDICFVEGIPVQTDYLRSGGDIYVVPFLKDVYVVHLSINELITEVK